MNVTDKQLRALLAQQASEWFVLNDAESLEPRQIHELIDWLSRSPEHVAEFLAVAEMARDLRAVHLDDPSLQALVERARVDEDESIQELEFGRGASEVVVERASTWRLLAAAAVAIATMGTGILWWYLRPGSALPPNSPPAVEARLRTGHDEQRTWQLAD